jgi:hypothetical protein
MQAPLQTQHSALSTGLTMDATLEYSPPRPASRPLSERVNVRLIAFLVLVSLPFAWCLWLILDQRMIVNKGDYYEVDLKAMGDFPFDDKQDTELAVPPAVRELDGKKVRFEGEMYAPNESTSQVQSFQLVYSIVECCLGGPPKVQERVFAYVPEGKRVRNYSGRQVTCVGTLHVEVEKFEGQTISVFSMEVDEVQARD